MGYNKCAWRDWNAVAATKYNNTTRNPLVRTLELLYPIITLTIIYVLCVPIFRPPPNAIQWLK